MDFTNSKYRSRVYQYHFVNALPYDNENGDGQRDLEHEHKECMTDLAWQELVELEESYRNNLKDLFPLDAADEHSMCKGERNTVDIETMTDLDFEELEEIESCYHRYLDEKVSVSRSELTCHQNFQLRCDKSLCRFARRLHR